MISVSNAPFGEAKNSTWALFIVKAGNWAIGRRWYAMKFFGVTLVNARVVGNCGVMAVFFLALS